MKVFFLFLLHFFTKMCWHYPLCDSDLCATIFAAAVATRHEKKVKPPRQNAFSRNVHMYERGASSNFSSQTYYYERVCKLVFFSWSKLEIIMHYGIMRGQRPVTNFFVEEDGYLGCENFASAAHLFLKDLQWEGTQ